MTLGAYIRKKRKEQGVTMTLLADLLGIGLPCMHDFESGRRQNTIHIPHLARLLDLDVDYLYYLKGVFPPDIRERRVSESVMRRACEFLRIPQQQERKEHEIYSSTN